MYLIQKISVFSVRSEDRCLKQRRNVWHSPVGVKPLRLQFHPFERKPVGVKPLRQQFHPFERKRIINHACRVKHASVICAAALVILLYMMSYILLCTLAICYEYAIICLRRESSFSRTYIPCTWS